MKPLRLARAGLSDWCMQKMHALVRGSSFGGARGLRETGPRTATVCLISIYRGRTIGLYHCMALSFHWQYVVIYQLLLFYIIIVVLKINTPPSIN